jgi:hypothetical protein
MPARWERELRTIKNVPAPLERIRDRAARGPERLPAHDLPPRRQRVAAGVVAAAVFLAAGAFALRAWQTDPKAADAGTSSPPAWLIEEARTMASQNQDPSPTSARWLLTDARTAAPAVGLTPDQTSGQAEYLVVLEGHFVATGAKIPKGGEVPTGTTLVFTLDPADHQVLDWGVGDETVDVPGLVPFELGEVSPSPVGDPAPLASLASRTIDLEGYAGAVAAGNGSVWVAVLGADQEASLQRIDAATGGLEGSLALPSLPRFLAVGDGEVWVPVVQPGRTPALLEIDAATLDVTATLPGFTGPVVATGGVVWAVEEGPDAADANLVRIEGGVVTARVPVGEVPFDIVQATGSIWVQERRDQGDVAGSGGVLRLDPTTGEVLARLDLPAAGLWLAGDDRGVWLSASLGAGSSDSGSTSAVIAPDTNALAPFGSVVNFRPFAVGEGSVWFVAGPHEGKLQGICGIDEVTGTATGCADVAGPDLEMAGDPAAYDPVTHTLWSGSYERKVVTRIDARP